MLSELLAQAAAAVDLPLSSAANVLLRTILGVAFTFAVVYFTCIKPSRRRTADLTHRVGELRRFHQDLERRFSEQDVELAHTRAKLHAESQAHLQASTEAQRLAAELEQRVLQRTSHLDGMVRTFQNELSERKRTIDSLRESEKQFRQFVELAPEGIWATDAQGKITFVNAFAAEMVGYTAPQLLGRSLPDLLVLEDLPASHQKLASASAAPFVSVDVRLRHKAGRAIWVRSSYAPLSDESKSHRGALMLFTDCTVQRIEEARLRERVALLDTAPDAIVTCDADLRILSWNQGAARLYGWTAQEMAGRPALDSLSEPSAANPTEEILRLLKQNGQWRGELSHVTKTGKKLFVDVRLASNARTPGTAGWILLVATDMTATRIRELQLRREQRTEAASSLIGGLAQELNNNLAPVLLSAEILRSKPLKNEEDALTTNIVTGSERAADLLKQALVFARGVEGERETLRPSQLLKDTVNVLRETFPRNIQILTESPAGIWSVQGDSTQLHQVLLKLCVQARDAMPSGGILTLRLKNLQIGDHTNGVYSGRKPGNYVLFEVQDTGPLFPATAHDRLFEPFFACKERNLAPSLGLAAASGTIRSHGGLIDLRSQSGVGTTLTLCLPAMADAETEPARAGAELPSGRGELILLVEDDAGLRDVTRTTLSRHGYQVLTAADGMEGLGLLAQHQESVKLVLTGIQTPSLDGPSLAREARKINPAIRVIASTGLGRAVSNPADKLAALQSNGIGRLLAKPYSAHELLHAVREELSQPAPAS